MDLKVMLTGRAPTQQADVFRSQAEVVEAMQDPRYDKTLLSTDVFAKLDRSNINYYTTITEDGGRQNLYAKEPPMTFDEKYTVNHNEKAEMLNGRLQR